jgi:hypothetical protein
MRDPLRGHLDEAVLVLFECCCAEARRAASRRAVLGGILIKMEERPDAREWMETRGVVSVSGVVSLVVSGAVSGGVSGAGSNIQVRFNSIQLVNTYLIQATSYIQTEVLLAWMDPRKWI